MLNAEVSSLLAPTRLGNHSVPGLWRFMLPEDVFYFRVDAEERSSCFSCPKVQESGFHPEVRCCTVIPRVPNFMIGLGLLAGNELFSSGLERGMFLPEGLIISPFDLNRSLEFIARPEPGLPAVICPFLDRASKRCGIYAFRNTTCSTFFCKVDRAEASERFWSDFADLGSQVESALSQWALQEVGFDLAAYFRALDELPLDLSKDWSLEAREKLFGASFGKEKELFIATAEAVLKRKKDLFEIASAFKPMQAKNYDAKLRSLLAGSISPELVEEALPVGEAESIGSLWYQLKLSARNLQFAPKTC